MDTGTVISNYRYQKISFNLNLFLFCQGPFKKFEYKPNEKKEIGMIAGGSGITPMYQVIDAISIYLYI